MSTQAFGCFGIETGIKLHPLAYAYPDCKRMIPELGIDVNFAIVSTILVLDTVPELLL